MRIIYKDAESAYSELLEKDCAVTIHTKNLQLLMTEMYKTRNDLNPSFRQEIFCENESHYNLRNNNEFVQPRVRSVGNGTDSVRFKGPQLWQMLLQTIRNSGSLAQFKANIKNWKGEIVHASCVALSFRTWAFMIFLEICFIVYFDEL